MSAIVMMLLRNSLRGGVLIAAVLLLRLLLRKLPKRNLCLLWTAVWLRLALPFSIHSRFSILPHLDFLEGPLPGSASAHAATAAQAGTAQAATAFWGPASILTLIWAVGLCALLIYALIRFLLLKRSVREAIPLRDRLWLCDWVESPFLLGLFRPRIYLPSGVEERDIPWIVAHEEAHLRRGDPWLKLTAFLLTAIYWFQPLVWVAFFLYRRDLELACDERAVRDLGAEDRSSYVEALMCASTPGRNVWAAPLAFGSAPVRKRIEAILHPSGCGHRKLVLAALLCAVVLLTLTVEPVQAARTAPEAEQPEVGRSEHSENIGWVIRTDKDGAEIKWFLVSDPTGDVRILLLPDGSSEALPDETVIMRYDEEPGQILAIGPFSPGGDAP